MCGICGYIGTNKISGREMLEQLNQTLYHRGPDAGDVWLAENVGLGNRRLKILDLSDNGNQPMISQNGRFVIVYNGEVYNYLELAKELKERFGTTLRTGTDTEVILEAFAHYGRKTFAMLNGMFAIAIYDKEKKTLLLARDRSGIKPLYYHHDSTGGVIFASELNSFRVIKDIPLQINRDIVPVFLHLGFIPTPWSIYRNIYKVRPGTILEMNGHSVSEERFYTFLPGGEKLLIRKETVALDQLEELMLSSVKYQLQSDVPVGIFLSGGTDSSLVAAIAAKAHTKQVNTFTIGFRENKFDESVFAEKVAKQLGTNHHPFIVSLDDATEMLEKVTDVYGEPFADSSAIPTMIVSRLAKKHVSVTLSGEGGDELFYGYGSYRWARRLSNPFLRGGRKIAELLLRATKLSRNQRVAEMLAFESDTYLPSHIFSQEQYFFSDIELRRLMSYHPGIMEGHFHLFETRLRGSQRKLSPKERQALYDQDYYLPGDLLVKVDRASMHFSLETRVPYLDHRIIEFAGNLHEGLKVKNGTDKYLLKKLLFRYLPSSLFERPKQGFTIPLDLWMRNSWDSNISTYLSKEIVERHGFVRYDEVQSVLSRYKSGKQEFLYNRIWALITLHRWLEKFHG